MTHLQKMISLPLPKTKVREEIARIAAEASHRLEVLDHAADRMQQRDVLMRQIMNVLKDGDLMGSIDWDVEKERGWKCRLSRVTGGARVTVVAKLVRRETHYCLVVTTWQEEC